MMRQQTDDARSRHGLLELCALDALTAGELIERVHQLARAGHGDHAIAGATRLDVASVRHALSGQFR
jgi:hypothetical protein